MLIGVFAAIAIVHHEAETKLSHKVDNGNMKAWLLLLCHPVTLITIKDWLIHIFVYSKFALIAAH